MRELKLLGMASIIGLSLLSQPAQAERVKFLDAYMISINPKAKLNGPIFKNVAEEKGAYGDELAKVILEEAHEKSKRYLEYGDFKGYYTFMALALTVPLHEGLYVHFRDVENEDGLCRKRANEGKTIKSSIARRHFRKSMVKGFNPFLLKCRKLANENRLRQMIAGGGDGSDIGIMQLSSRWHYDEFLAKKKFASVRSTVNYGLAHLVRGYKPAYANYKKYPCLQNEDGSLNYKNLARGSWSGIYNSGNLGQTCRFADPTNAHAKKDNGFLDNLNKTLALAEGGIFGYNENLSFPISEGTRNALKEVIENHLNGTNNNTALNALLNNE